MCSRALVLVNARIVLVPPELLLTFPHLGGGEVGLDRTWRIRQHMSFHGIQPELAQLLSSFTLQTIGDNLV